MHAKWAMSAAAAALALATTAAAYEGPVFRVSVWRGETAWAKMPDNLAGEIADYDGCGGGGVIVDLFAQMSVQYATEVGGSTLRDRLDVLVGMYMADMPEYEGAAFPPPSFCRIAVARDAKPGVRSFGPLEVRVSERVLPPPSEWKYFLDLWQHPWAVSRYFGVEPFSREHYARMEPVWKELADCGCKALTVTLLDLPWNHQCYDAYHSMVGRTKNEDGSWTFDYSVFDEYVAFGRSCGIGPDIACYTMCPWGYVVRWQDAAGATHRAEAKPGTQAFEEYWGPFLPDFAAHLKEKGWFDDAYIAMDERSPEDVRLIAEFVRAKAPGLKIAMAGNRKPSDFKGIAIDNYSQGLKHLTDDFLPELAPRRARGQKTTYYVCCSLDFPNTFMKSGDDEGYWLTAYAALSGFDGFLRWAANSWPAEPYASATFGNWLPGDAYLIYPNAELSARLAALRAGVVAAEKLRILREAGAVKDEEVAALAEKYGYRKAFGGEFRMAAFRREMEKLVSR